MSVKELLDDLPYGPAPDNAGLALSWLEAHRRRFGLIIGGEFQTPRATFVVYNPAKGDEIAQPRLADHADVDAIWDLSPTAPDSEKRSAGNLKQCRSPSGFDVRELLLHAVQVKNVWVPHGA